MKKTKNKKISADQIGEKADRGENVVQYYSGKGMMMAGHKRVVHIQRVNVDITDDMLKELDEAAHHLNVSRQAVIKTLIRQGLNQGLLSKKSS